MWKRVVLKISGEALAGDNRTGIDFGVAQKIVQDIISGLELGIEIGLVVGGGNLCRGEQIAGSTKRVTADHMGMLATAMNAIALRDIFANYGVACGVLSGLPLPTVCETFSQRLALSCLATDKLVLFCGGIGSPFFTTDTAAVLRAAEIGADAILKATNVDGVYSQDPKLHPEAKRYKHLTFDEAISRKLKVMDATALALAREQDTQVIVYAIHARGSLRRILETKGFASDLATIIKD